MRQIDGQMSIFDFIPEPDPVDEWELPCDTCKFDVKGCCAYDRPLGDFCRLGDKWQPKEPEECVFSGHTCNKTFLWQVADTLDEIMCPHVCCRKCNTRLCGARCNGSEEPRQKTPAEEYFEETGKKTYWQDSQDKPHRWWRSEDEYIRDNPTCFYVFGHYLDRANGWHKMPEDLPTFKSWTCVDVVIFGKKTSTAWMEHGKWEAKDWTFRSIDDRGNAETVEILAWKISEDINEDP